MIRSQVFCCYRKLLRQNYAVLFALGTRVEYNVSLFFYIIIVLLETDCFPIFKKTPFYRYLFLIRVSIFISGSAETNRKNAVARAWTMSSAKPDA